MHFDSFPEFLAMGGYGFYVWLAYGVSLGALVLLIVNSFFSRKHLFRSISKQSSRRARQLNASVKES